MNQTHDEFEELEAAMRRMPLKQPSPQLDERVLATIRTGGRQGRSRWVIGVIGTLAAAAMITIVLWPAGKIQTEPGGTTPTAEKTFQIAHVPTTDATEQWVDHGIVDYTPEGPVRQYVVKTVQQFASADGEGYLVQESLVQVVSQAY